MSAFIVSKECLERALSLWAHPINSWRRPLYPDDLDALGTRMQELNESAVAGRYRESLTSGPPVLTRFSVKSVRPLVALKALQCLIYQCSEGDIPEKSTLYSEMRDVERATMGEIVREMPEWRDAPWG